MTFRRTAALLLATVSAGGLTAAQATQPAPAGTGWIGGRVVDAVTGTPLPSVVVALGSGIPAVAALAGGSERRIVTDGQGRFLFRNLRKGSYALTVSVGGNGYSAGGFLVSGMPSQIGAYLNGAYGQRRPNGPSETIELADDQHLIDVVIKLWKGASIDGTVVDEAGEPLVGLIVSAVRRSSDGRLLNGPTAKTDDRGQYHVDTLEPGDYLVVVPQTQVPMPSVTVDQLLADIVNPALTERLRGTGLEASSIGRGGSASGMRVGGAIMSAPPAFNTTNALPPVRQGDRLYVYQTTFHPASVAATQATVVRLQSGEERTGVDIRLQPAPTVALSGRLVDAGGPVPNFAIHLMPGTAGDGTSVLEVATTSTDRTGDFVFPLVPPGNYTLLALRNATPVGPRAGGPGAIGVAAPVLADQAGAWAEQPVAVGDANVAGVILTLRAGATVRGRVAFQGPKDLPPDRIRRSVSLVRAQPPFRTSTQAPTAPFGPTGEFTVTGVAPGRYVLRVSDDGYADWSLQSILINGREMADVVVDVDGDLANVDVVLTDRPAGLSGTVVGTSGSADAEAAVFIFPADQTRWRDARASVRSFRTARVSKTGAFTVSRLIPGEYFAVAVPDALAGDWPNARFLSRLAPLATKVRVDPAQRPVLSLTTVRLQ